MVYNKEKDIMKKIICALTLIITVLAGSINICCDTGSISNGMERT